MDKAVLGFQGRKLSTPLNAAAEEKPSFEPWSYDFILFHVISGHASKIRTEWVKLIQLLWIQFNIRRFSGTWGTFSFPAPGLQMLPEGD
jgi:hypothetical protein